MGAIAFFQVSCVREGCPRALSLHLQPAPFCNINVALINVSSAFYPISPHHRLPTFKLGIMQNVLTPCALTLFPGMGLNSSDLAQMFSRWSDSLASQPLLAQLGSAKDANESRFQLWPSPFKARFCT